MSDKELMQQALEALEINNQAWKQLADSGDAGFWEAEEQPFYGTSVKAMNALRERLAQPEQEPRREWVGLTDEEIKMLPQWYPSHETAAALPLIRAVEAKLKQRNT